jgi:ribonuclease-3 family protein
MRRELKPLELAFLGDAVYGLYIRHYLLLKGVVRPFQLQRQSVRFVAAKAQARVLKHLMPLLSEAEKDVVRRGRNAKPRSVPKNTDVLTYKQSSAFEALIGHLYLENNDRRLEQLIDESILFIENNQDGQVT